MTVTLRQVLDIFAYSKEAQQLALTKLAAFRGCFNEDSKDKLISDEDAQVFLEKPFETMEEGILWFGEVTQKNWLRTSFQKEGIGSGKDPVVNVERWMNQDTTSFSNDDEHQLLSMFQSLELINTVPFPEQPVKHIVVHGALEGYASERINFIPDFSGHLYYISNPRGLFNNEPSLAPILASWFNKPEALHIIQSVLNNNQDLRTSDKHWLKDLGGLKSDILDALGETEWPTEKGWYYKNPEPFDWAAQREGRQSLAGWPTAVDMVEYLIKQKESQEPGTFNQIDIIPVYSIRPGRIANTEDTIVDWYNSFGKYLAEDTPVVFISNNSCGLHYIHYQDVILQTALQNISENKLNVMTVGRGANEISLSAAADVFARVFYTKKPGILKLLQEQKSKEMPGYSQKDFNQFGFITGSSSKKQADLQKEGQLFASEAASSTPI